MPNSIVSIEAPTKTHNLSNVAVASTLEELLACVPRTFQHAYRNVFREWHDTAIKLSHAKHALSSFTRHQVGGTFPPNILGALKVPTIQVCKEYDGTSQRQEDNSSFELQVTQWRQAALQAAITLKEREVAHIESLISKDRSVSVNNTVKSSVWKALSSTFAAGINEKGETMHSPFFTTEFALCRDEGAIWLRKASAIGLAKHQRELVTKMSKLSMKKETDTDAMDLSTNDVRKTIAEEIAKALGRASGSKSKQKPKQAKQPKINANARVTKPGKRKAQDSGKGRGSQKRRKS